MSTRTNYTRPANKIMAALLFVTIVISFPPTTTCFQPLLSSITATRTQQQHMNPLQYANVNVNSMLTTMTTTSLHTKNTNQSNNDDDFGSLPPGGNPGEDTYDGDVDWDAEWKKVVEKRDQPSTRPGQYKNEVERAMLKTTKATSEQLKKVKIVKPDINIKSLQGDPKFWFAILAIISVGVSLISAAGVETYSNSSENFYV